MSLKLGFGTVQWGQIYGIANRGFRPGEAEVRGILELGRQAGVTLLDTAHNYGDAEVVLGRLADLTAAFQVVTKTPSSGTTTIGPAETAEIAAAFETSLTRLARTRVEGLLLHNADDLLLPGSERLWGLLESLKERKQVERIGISVYHPEQVERIMTRFRVDTIQLPFNIYDQRFARGGLLRAARAAGAEIHARSPFLQGLLLMAADTLPLHFAGIREHHEHFRTLLRSRNQTPLSACLNFSCAQEQIDKVIVGFDSIAQCGAAIQALTQETEQTAGFEEFAIDDPDVIVPSRWR